jgi:hypothetical protein
MARIWESGVVGLRMRKRAVEMSFVGLSMPLASVCLGKGACMLVGRDDVMAEICVSSLDAKSSFGVVEIWVSGFDAGLSFVGGVDGSGEGGGLGFRRTGRSGLREGRCGLVAEIERVAVSGVVVTSRLALGPGVLGTLGLIISGTEGSSARRVPFETPDALGSISLPSDISSRYLRW